MQKHLWILIVSTFIFGFASGVIVYLMSGQGGGGLREDTSGFVIAGHVYGVCQTAETNRCPSYRITNNGEYTFKVVDGGGTPMQFDGEIEETHLSRVESAIDTIDFSSISSSKFQGACPANAGGVAFRYEIDYKGERYSFDSCVQRFGSETLFKVLESYFVLFTEKHAKRP